MMAADLFIVGLGPGATALLTPQAREFLEAAETIVGYHLYLRLLPEDVVRGKTVLSTGMRHERERCQQAIAAAMAGSPVALVCSGDAGIYGMAGLVLELLDAQGLMATVPVTVAAGVPAFCAAAALLGAPLMHDFACVSLSDLLTPWERIEQRLHAAFQADFVVVIYNPRSQGRPGHLGRALEIARQYCAPETPVGLVRKAYRPGQEVSVTALHDFQVDAVDMLSLLIIGNSSTRSVGMRMITSRGYRVD